MKKDKQDHIIDDLLHQSEELQKQICEHRDKNAHLADQIDEFKDKYHRAVDDFEKMTELLKNSGHKFIDTIISLNEQLSESYNKNIQHKIDNEELKFTQEMLNDELMKAKGKNGKIKNRLNEITVRLKHSDRHGKEDKHLEELLEKSKKQVTPPFENPYFY